MTSPLPCGFVRSLQLALILWTGITTVQAQNLKPTLSPAATDRNGDLQKQSAAHFLRGRRVPGQSAAELRRRAYVAKMKMRTARTTSAVRAMRGRANLMENTSGTWTPLGPAPLASDASGNGSQDYGVVSGRATAVAVDPADPSGNTVFIGAAQGGIWKSINAANSNAALVTWIPVADNQETLSIGSLAIQPGNADPAGSVILAATGEGNNSANSYFGLGILRSADGGDTWTLISTANGGTLSFSGLGGSRMAFSTASAQTNTVVSAMATTEEGAIDGAVTGNTARGLYTSIDAGQDWTYDALLDPGGAATDATSATGVAYNGAAGLFFASVRYHGFYSSPDGTNWTRLVNQPGGALLSTSACPPLSTENFQTCPIFRGEISVVPGHNEMYAWFLSLDSFGNPVDEGIWQSTNSGATWIAMNDSGITNCGDPSGCGVAQGIYNLELLAVPNGGAATDLYAGAVNLFKCSITSINPTCANSPFLNLTHAYGCPVIAELAHVHPSRHALAFALPASGADSGNDLMYFANDGGIYRSLNGFTGLSTGSCSGVNAFDDLNQNLGSLTQFISFSQHPTDPATFLGGTQGNGSPATNVATTTTSWINVLDGDGGYNAIDPTTPLNWFASNPDIPPGGLNIEECGNGINCRDANFNAVVTSSSLGGDDGDFYVPYILDPQSATALLVGTCRVWRGPRLGGSYTALSNNFDTFGTGACTGEEIDLVLGIAAGGALDSNGFSNVIYATTAGEGPLAGPLQSPSGGHVWVTTNAAGGTNTFTDVTGGINPNQSPVSSVAIDNSDSSGQTAYVTIMGFTGATGHVWQTTNAGATWTDFTGNGVAALHDSPVNAVLVDPAAHTVYVGTDVGVFQSGTVTPGWSEVGPVPLPNATQSGFLPDVAVTALALFNSGGQKLLRASTYGRGLWQFNLNNTPDFTINISSPSQTVFPGQTATFNGTLTALNGYNNSVALSCTMELPNLPGACTPFPLNPTPLATGGGATFTITVPAGSTAQNYTFNVQAAGTDPGSITHSVPVTLNVVNLDPDFLLAEPTPFPNVKAGSANTGGTISIASQDGFAGTVALTCSLTSGTSGCGISPSSITAFPANATVTVNSASLVAGSYQLTVQGVSGSTTHSLAVPFNVGDYALAGTTSLTVAPGAQGTANLTLTPSAFYSEEINAGCDARALPNATCTLLPANPITIASGTIARSRRPSPYRPARPRELITSTLILKM